MVRPKKKLGQHFLTDNNIAGKIVYALRLADTGLTTVLEIGPGTGVLTKFLASNPAIDLHLAEIDTESIDHLKKEFPQLASKIMEGDFLQMDLAPRIQGPFSIIGNFPYNISSQIFFKVLEHRHEVRQVVCMLQKEVADRISAPPGSKVYGILSVLLQAYYDIEFLFKVPPGVFFPPPKVMSGVIRLTRNQRTHLDCDEVFFQQVVKQAFQKRRKTLRNALKHLNLPGPVNALDLMDKRPEQLSVDQFIFLTRAIQNDEGVRRV
ncbi:MAG: 16S rRNA (adenine(1518)-N(6)/adenine(1519)-N(6))-dimethyltransferase RsmA [Cyclobacteriaceae bacterium]|nr:16S rRNA (adenine(1518)-N(6)/adenine(1519)-N(6))-dimethyltransferase RsmA [Cyclobacteriaceae bacterium]